MLLCVIHSGSEHERAERSHEREEPNRLRRCLAVELIQVHQIPSGYCTDRCKILAETISWTLKTELPRQDRSDRRGFGEQIKINFDELGRVTHGWSESNT